MRGSGEGSAHGPSVSIVLPAFNVERYLAATVDSVLQQTFQAWELVIVDDGSSDGTGALADTLARTDDRITVIHQPNGGPSRARNAGLARSDPSSDAVIFLDSDDIWEPQALQLLSVALRSQPDAVAVYGFPRLFDAHREPWPDRLEHAQGRMRNAVRDGRRIAVPVDAPATFEVLCVWSCIATGGQLLIRRAAISEAAPFVPGILSQDWLFWIRLSRCGAIIPIDEFVIRKRERADSVMRSPRFGQAEMIIRRRLIELPEITSSEIEIARDGHRFATLERLSWAWSSLRRGRVVAAAKHVRHFVIARIVYTKMRAEYAASAHAARAADGATTDHEPAASSERSDSA